MRVGERARIAEQMRQWGSVGICDLLPSVQVVPGLSCAMPDVSYAGEVLGVRGAVGDNDVLHRCVESVEPGQVVAFEVEPGGNCAYLGDNIAGKLLRRGATGVILGAEYRDSRGIQALGLGLHALGTDPRRPNRRSGGEVGVDVRVNGVAIRCGMWAVGDVDGLVLIEPAQVGDLMASQPIRSSASAVLSGGPGVTC